MTKLHKIIHIDMDCFYAAIEIRDNPALANKPVAVGGASDRRGVLCTCNYIARQYGVRSAMPTATALRLCKDLVLLPVNMAKYREAAATIHSIFHEYTDLVEPLSLDEAYLDVSDVDHHQGSATLIAKAIRQRIWDSEKLTASAGVAPNKFLAKVASGWKKPNGLFVIKPDQVEAFIKDLPITELWGVGKVTAKKMHALGINTCADLQQFSLPVLTTHFGKLGQHLYDNCRGIDLRTVTPDRVRKSLSVERTFEQDINNAEDCIKILHELHDQLLRRLHNSAPDYRIKNQFIKIKYYDFKQTTIERSSETTCLEQYLCLFQEAYQKNKKAIRLLGLGVHFQHDAHKKSAIQLSLLGI